MIPLTGYADRWSVAPGETIAFKVSSTACNPYQVRLVKVICGDPNPDGPGIKEHDLSAVFAGRYASRIQAVSLGSYARVPDAPPLHRHNSVTMAATIWPTTPQKDLQGVIAKHDPMTGTGFALGIDTMGAVALVGAGAGKVQQVSVGKPLRERAWYHVWGSYDAGRQTLSVGQIPLQTAFRVDDAGAASSCLDGSPSLKASSDLLFGALGGLPVTGHFNGKIERPMVIGRALDDAGIGTVLASDRPTDVVGLWDFSQAVSSRRVVDLGPHGLHGELVNLPARGMTGSNWTGAEMCWRHAPEQYGAIHFHEDDIYDCGWETDFSFTVPADFKSGVYAMRLTGGTVSDMIPFFVRPRPGHPQTDACVLIPTFTYTVYANFARGVTNDAYRERVAAWGARPWTADEHRDYGLSTYNYHLDGSGICYASYLRPLITMRSGCLSYLDPRGSGLRHFPADTHLIDWLDAMGHEVDIITDHDLHAEGIELIAPYKVVMTASHPEYHTRDTLDALSAYTRRGGRLMYLGGNGFYWRVALNPAWPGAVEIRRAEGGIRTWAAEPGEYFNSFDGHFGGLWRRNGRPPQQLTGVGFTSQGIFEGACYRRRPESRDPRVAWMFDGVEGEILGDFGLSGGGAAGFELDRADARLGTPPNALVVARSERHKPENFILVHEERLNKAATWPGEPAEQLIRADMVYFETPHGGAVFSVGSITFCGSLFHNRYDNNISRLIDNVLTRFRTAHTT